MRTRKWLSLDERAVYYLHAYVLKYLLSVERCFGTCVRMCIAAQLQRTR